MTIAALDPCARFSLRLSRQTAAERGSVAGFALTGTINSCRIAGDRVALRLGPDEWLLTTPRSMRETVAREIADALQGQFHSVIDISDRNERFEVSGPRARDVINGACALDLDDASFPAGTATRTLFGKADVVLIRPGNEPHYQLESLRSFAPYVRALLGELAREFDN